MRNKIVLARVVKFNHRVGGTQPLCIKCGSEMICERNGVVVYYKMDRPTPGPVQHQISDISVADADRTIKFRKGDMDLVIFGDMYRCLSCGAGVVVGFSRRDLLSKHKGTLEGRQVQVLVR
jgi:hypothetical protein